MFGDSSEVVSFEIDASAAKAGAREANAAIESIEDKAVGSFGNANRAVAGFGETVIRYSDRSRSSIERLVSSAERMASTYGKTGVEKLVADRDRLIARLGSEATAVDRVTAAYARAISEQQKMESAGDKSGGTGFSFRYAFFGLKDILEGRTKNAIAEAANELVRFRGAALGVGVAVGLIAGIGYAAYETHEKLRELAEAPAKLRREFAAMNGELAMNADELRKSNVQLENTIAKLQHKPQNLMAEALAETRVEAGKLVKTLDAALESLTKVVGEKGVGFFNFGHLLFGVQGTGDIEKHVKAYEGVARDIAYAGNQNIRNAGSDPDAVSAARNEMNVGLAAARRSALSFFQGELQKAQTPQPAAKGTIFEANDQPEQRAQRAEMLKGIISNLNLQGDIAALTAKHGDLEKENKLIAENVRIQRERYSLMKEIDAIAHQMAGYAESPEQKVKAEYQRGLDRLHGTTPDERAIFQTLTPQQQSFEEWRLKAGMEKGLANIREEREKKFLESVTESNISAEGLSVSIKNEAHRKQLEDLRDEQKYGPIGGITTPFGRVTQTQLPALERGATSEDKLKDATRSQQLQERLIGLSDKDEFAKAKQLMESRVDFAAKAYYYEGKIADLKLTVAERDQAHADALDKAEQRLYEAKVEHEIALAEVQHKHLEEVKRETESLLHTLFTNPSNFGKQLSSTLRDAVLKPIESGIADMIKGPIDKIIHGPDGQTGIVGFWRNLFGGNKPDTPAQATAKNTADTVDVLKQIRDLLGGGPGSSGSPAVRPAGGGGFSGFGGFGLGLGLGGMLTTPPFLPSAAAAEAAASGGGSSTAGLSQMGGWLGGLWDRTGSPAMPSLSMTDMNGVPLSATPPFAGGSIPGIGSSGNGGGGGLFGSLFNPKSLMSGIFNRGEISMGDYSTMTAGDISASMGGISGSLVGGLAGFASSPMGGMLGGSLAMAGILGKNPRGLKQTAETVGGAGLLGANIGSKIPSLGIMGGAIVGTGAGLLVNGFQRKGALGALESAGGGAMIGWQFGGPLGAAIGAVAGLGIGLLGNFVKSFREQVQDQVQKLYGVKLDPQMADQIGQIAKQSYGGSISTAIRSPQVMDMLSAYSAATGQKFLFSNQPRPAYLTESGGTLTQQATYVNGQAYSYASQAGLPTYGGVSTQTLPQYNLGQTTSVVGGQPVGGISIQLDGRATTAVLRGEIANAPQEVAESYSAAQQNSFDRRAGAARMLRPGLVNS